MKKQHILILGVSTMLAATTVLAEQLLETQAETRPQTREQPKLQAQPANITSPSVATQERILALDERTPNPSEFRNQPVMTNTPMLETQERILDKDQRIPEEEMRRRMSAQPAATMVPATTMSAPAVQTNEQFMMQPAKNSPDEMREKMIRKSKDHENLKKKHEEIKSKVRHEKSKQQQSDHLQKTREMPLFNSKMKTSTPAEAVKSMTSTIPNGENGKEYLVSVVVIPVITESGYSTVDNK